MPTATNTPQMPASSPRIRVKWTLIGVAILISPLVWYAIASLWYGIYDPLFKPQHGESSYDWASITLVLPAALLFGLFTLVLGICVIVSAQKSGQKSVKFRQRALWSVSIVATAWLVIYIFFSFLAWGGRTPLDRPNYPANSQTAKADIQQALLAVDTAGQVTWPDGVPTPTKYVDVEDAWCSRWNYSVIYDTYDERPTAAGDPSTVLSDVYSALGKIDWHTERGVGDGGYAYVYAYKTQTTQADGATENFYFDSQADQENGKNDSVYINITSACFID
jgi:hypothetical protein